MCSQIFTDSSDSTDYTLILEGCCMIGVVRRVSCVSIILTTLDSKLLNTDFFM